MNVQRFSGEGGGGLFGGGGTVQPDDIFSTDTMEIILGLCEGKILGPVNGLQNVFVGTTPVQNEDLSYNFGNFDIRFYPGDSTPVPVKPQLGGLSNNTVVNQQLYQGVPVTRTTVENNIDYIDIRLVISALYSTDSDGNTTDGNFVWIIEYKQTSSPTWINIVGWENNGGQFTLTAKTTSGNFVEGFRIPVLRVADTYDIRITKVTPENTAGTGNFVTVDWESFQEITATSLVSPNTAILQIIGQASDQFSSIPNFYALCDGFCELKIPSNYDPIARTYTGVWDGTFQLGWTNNPAWFLYNFVINTNWGMSSIRPMTIDKYDTYDAAQWCDGSVPDGQGGFQPRYTFNALVQDPRSGIEFLRYVAGAFNAAAFDDGNGSISLKVDKDDPATNIFSKENVVDGIFNYSFTDAATRYNDLTVSFNNEELEQYAEDRRRVFDQTYINKYGRVPLDFIAVGATNEHEAIRRATYKLITSTTEVTSVNFKTNRQGAFVNGFDVILISDADMGWSISGRILLQTGARTFTVRDPVFAEVGISYAIQFQTPSGPFTANLVGMAAGYNTTLTVDADLPSNLPLQAVFAMENTTGGISIPKPFRVMMVKPVDGDNEQIEVTAVEINRLKWDAADNAVPVGTIDYSFKGHLAWCYPPGAVTVVQGWAKTAAGVHQDIEVSWEASPSPLTRKYKIGISKGHGPFKWIHETTSTERTATIENLSKGTYIVAVRAENIASNISKATYSDPIVINQSPYKIPRVTGLELDGNGNNNIYTTADAEFTWRVTSENTAAILDNPNQSASAGSIDETFDHYIVQIRDADTNKLLRTEHVPAPHYVYTFAKNRNDPGGPRRRFRIDVAWHDKFNTQSPFAKWIVNNPPPLRGTNVDVEPLTKSILLTYDPPDDDDWVGTIVWRSTSPTFPTDSTTQVFKGLGSSATIKATTGTTYYLCFAPYDKFGVTGLNVSSIYSVTV